MQSLIVFGGVAAYATYLYVQNQLWRNERTYSRDTPTTNDNYHAQNEFNANDVYDFNQNNFASSMSPLSRETTSPFQYVAPQRNYRPFRNTFQGNDFLFTSPQSDEFQFTSTNNPFQQNSFQSNASQSNNFHGPPSIPFQRVAPQTNFLFTSPQSDEFQFTSTNNPFQQNSFQSNASQSNNLFTSPQSDEFQFTSTNNPFQQNSFQSNASQSNNFHGPPSHPFQRVAPQTNSFQQITSATHSTPVSQITPISNNQQLSFQENIPEIISSPNPSKYVPPGRAGTSKYQSISTPDFSDDDEEPIPKLIENKISKAEEPIPKLIENKISKAEEPIPKLIENKISKAEEPNPKPTENKISKFELISSELSLWDEVGELMNQLKTTKVNQSCKEVNMDSDEFHDLIINKLTSVKIADNDPDYRYFAKNKDLPKVQVLFKDEEKQSGKTIKFPLYTKHQHSCDLLDLERKCDICLKHEKIFYEKICSKIFKDFGGQYYISQIRVNKKDKQEKNYLFRDYDICTNNIINYIIKLSYDMLENSSKFYMLEIILQNYAPEVIPPNKHNNRNRNQPHNPLPIQPQEANQNRSEVIIQHNPSDHGNFNARGRGNFNARGRGNFNARGKSHTKPHTNNHNQTNKRGQTNPPAHGRGRSNSRGRNHNNHNNQ